MDDKIVYLIRHGRTDEAHAGQYIGATDVVLAPPGIQQMTTFAKYHRAMLDDAQHCFCSPLQRCQHTATLLALRSTCVVDYRQELREIDFGRWERMTSAAIAEHDGAHWQQFLANPTAFDFPAGESHEQFHRRSADFLTMLHAHPAKQIIVVCHAGVIRQLLCLALDIPRQRQFAFEIPFASLTTLRLYNDGGGVLLGLGDTCYQRMSEGERHG